MWCPHLHLIYEMGVLDSFRLRLVGSFPARDLATNGLILSLSLVFLCP